MNRIPLVGETKTKILHELCGKRGKTASEIALALDIQVSAVRKHLEALHSEGIVVGEFVRDGIGRPKKFYSLSETGREMFPRQYELVLNSLIQNLIEATDRTFVESLLHRVATDMDLSKSIGVSLSFDDDDFDSRVDRLSESMSEIGFDSSVERSADGTIRILSRNCPVYKSAKQFPDLMCQGLHNQFLKSALKTDHVKLEECILSGSSKCVHAIDKPKTL